MRTKSLHKNTINVITLGCSKNIYDSEVLMGQLRASGKEVVHEKEGNIVVINTCGFIDNAKEESVNTILEQIQKKQAGEVDKVYVTGCLSQRYKPDLEKCGMIFSGLSPDGRLPEIVELNDHPWYIGVQFHPE